MYDFYRMSAMLKKSVEMIELDLHVLRRDLQELEEMHELQIAKLHAEKGADSNA